MSKRLVRLGTFAEVVEYLGGPAKLARTIGRSKNAVCNWRNRGTFPSRLYFEMSEMLREQGAFAPRELWGFAPRSGSIDVELSDSNAAA